MGLLTPKVLRKAVDYLNVNVAALQRTIGISEVDLRRFLGGADAALAPATKSDIVEYLEGPAYDAYFEFEYGMCTDVGMVNYGNSFQVPIDLQRQSETYAIDARRYLHAAKMAQTHARSQEKRGTLALPAIFLCCHSIELSLKSYLLAATGSEASLRKGGRLTHDLIWLLDQCRNHGCERKLSISVAEYYLVDELAKIHGRTFNRYREVTNSHVTAHPEQTFSLTLKLSRMSRPQLDFPQFRSFGDTRINLVVPASGPDTRKKPPLVPQ